MPFNRLPLVRRQVLGQQPGPPPVAEQVSVRALRHEVSVQDGLRDGLQPYPLAHDLVAPRDLPPQCQGPRVRNPDLGQEVAGVELRQDRCVNGIGLDLGMRDQPHLTRVGDDDVPDVRCDHFHHRCGISSRLHHDVVVVRQRSGKCLQMVSRHADPPEADDLAVIQHHRLGEHAVDIQSHDPHRPASLPSCST